jgi:hypothetical protein
MQKKLSHLGGIPMPMSPAAFGKLTLGKIARHSAN